MEVYSRALVERMEEKRRERSIKTKSLDMSKTVSCCVLHFLPLLHLFLRTQAILVPAFLPFIFPFLECLRTPCCLAAFTGCAQRKTLCKSPLLFDQKYIFFVHAAGFPSFQRTVAQLGSGKGVLNVPDVTGRYRKARRIFAGLPGWFSSWQEGRAEQGGRVQGHSKNALNVTIC